MSQHYPILSNQGLDPLHQVEAYDQYGDKQQVNVAGEQPLTIKVDGDELVTLMTIGSQPELLVLGYLRNQAIFTHLKQIISVSVDWDREVAEVKSVDARGIRRGDSEDTGSNESSLIEYTLNKIRRNPLPGMPLHQSHIYQIINNVKAHNQTYRAAGSVHGCGLCKDGDILRFVEDVGRHGATDAISGEMWLKDIKGHDKMFYTTGRLTSEIVIKTALMGIPVLISRNGTTHMACELANELGITLIARAKSRNFTAINARDMVFDHSD